MKRIIALSLAGAVGALCATAYADNAAPSDAPSVYVAPMIQYSLQDNDPQIKDNFGYDAAIDYKAGQLAESLKENCPRGIDVYFDNTSGAITDAVLPQLAVGARIVICGTASISSWNPPPNGPRVERHILVKRARMSGFLAFDYQHRYEEAIARLAAWVRDGRIRYREEIVDGIESCPSAIAELYRGENLGKRLIRLAL